MAAPTSARLLHWTYAIYALHAVSAVAGILTAAFIVTAFVTGWPSLIAVVLNYVKRKATRGSYLESHFRWQIRTFWYAALWLLLAWLLTVTVVGIPLAYVIAWMAGLWVLYRIARGVLRLVDAQPMPL